MKENEEKFVKLVDFYNRLNPQEKLRFQKLLSEKIEELKAKPERDAQND